MPTEFKLPELGENVEKGDVVRVLVAAGDTVSVDQPILELETDKRPSKCRHGGRQSVEVR